MKNLMVLFFVIPLFSHAQIIPSRIKIARDSFGVPHIFAPTDAEVAYGLAWAHAEDDFATLQLVMLSGKAMLGTALGKKGAQADYVVQLLRCRELVDEQWNTLSLDFIALIKGYVKGLNDYAQKHPKEVVYQKAFPFNEHDYLAAVVFSLSMFCGVDQALTNILGERVALIPGFGYEGSNAFAFHPSKTISGEAFLAINAHQPVEGPTAFYEAHLQSEEGWNMLGGLFPGGCLIFHGTNEHLGWAHTVNNPDKIDVFQLKVNPRNNNQYWFDGKWIDIETKKAKLKIKGVPVTVSKAVYWSKYGATVKTKNGLFSIRLPANMDCRALEQWYRMNKAKNFSEFYQALNMVSLPMFNIMYADRYDTIFYISNAKLPIRNPNVRYNWISTLPGDTSATLWTKFKPVAALPQYVNPGSGFLYNTNHSPFNASEEQDNLDYRRFDPNDGFETYENNRSERFRELMPKSGKVSYERFKSIKFDQQFPQNLQFDTDIKNMITLDTNSFVKLKPLIKNLAYWDHSGDTASKGAAVFLLAYEYVSKKLKNRSRRQLTKEDAVEIFEFIYDYSLTNFKTIEPTLGDVQKLIRGNNVLPASGLPDMLAATYATPYRDGLFKVTSGDAYICLVRYPKKGLPLIESVNTYGSSSHSNSPHFSDQMKLFQTKKMKTMTLDKQIVLQTAERIYFPGQLTGSQPAK